MDDLISRTWLLAEYDKRHKGPPGGARKLIEEAPSAQPELKKGKWMKNGWAITCSECGYDMPYTVRYFCPNCGADMRGEQDG